MKLGSQDSGRYSNLDKSPLATNLKTNPSYLSPNYDFSNLKNNTMPNTVPNTGPNAEFQRTGNGGSNAHGYANLKTRYNVNDVKTITKDSQRRILGAISMSDLFKQNIDNRDMKESSYSKILNSASRKQQLEILHNEHRLQVQKLLLQISRLHDVIYELERSKKYEVQRIKQECEQVTYLHISNIKQSQISQMQILQIQLKKTKQILENKSTEFEELYRTTTKEKQLLKSEIQLLRNSVKDLVNKKNQEVFEIKKENDEKVKQLNRSNNNAIQEMKQLCDREIKKLYKQLQDKEDKVMKLQEQYEQTYSRNGQLEDQIEKQKAVLEQKLSQYVKETNKRYQGLIQHVSTVLNDQEVSLNEREATVKQIYDVEIANLLKIIKLKNEQNIRINAQLQTQRLEYRLLSQNIENQNEQILRLLRNQKLKNLQQLELLKVKMAILHQNDIKQLVNLYETKIECLNQELSKQSTETTRLRQFMHGQLARSYESKKKYEDTISKLNVQILRLKSGLGSLEKQMKQRIQSQRSAMLLTSKSLIRGVQLKNTNTKFYEQQLRKLRLTIQKQEHDFEKNEKILKQQIHNLQQQMNKLIDLSKQNEKQNQKIEEEYIKTIEDKQNQIKRLNQLARDLIQENGHGESEEIKEMGKQIERLNQQVQEKNQKLKQLQNKLDKLDRDLQQCKIQNEQLYLQNQINHEQAKGEYQKIASTNMRSLKQFYQRKLQQLQTDKQQLKNQRNLDKNTINQLVRKYQVMEDCMAKAVRQSKRKTKLEERIMDLGMDQNLVKNMGEIFRRDD